MNTEIIYNKKPIFCTHHVYDYGTSKVVGRDQNGRHGRERGDGLFGLCARGEWD
ncbi:hypothetical protein [Bacteroides sp. 51]|uniref:hypothetical protein n=1 Tax=Bacteroides sp. 51 TaxID=2302938 RepID=UPI0013D5914F|nr:hypothetical protein [Bacteroides sp. 51]